MNQLGKRLTQDHQELAGLLESLSQAADASDRQALASIWSEVEPRLIHHMDAEERYLLPLIEASHPAEVKRTLREHTRIRDLLCELGVAVELHAARSSDIQGLIELLRAHSQHEDEQLYVLAGDKASVAVEHSVLATLKTAVRAALHVSKPSAAGASAAPARSRS
jgi:hemerythrin-like domain-containing protein